MRRWNGWGDETIAHPLPPEAGAFLERLLGSARPPQDATLAEAVASVPPSRLPSHAQVSTDPELRLRHARGQSLPDWVALRSGRVARFPDGVAHPGTNDDVRELLRYAQGAGVRLIPYGGGTSVVGHVNPEPGSAPVLTVDLARLAGLLRFDQASQLATFGAGVAGPDLEAQLRARGFTLGHFPQSFEYSTLGGWVVTRSSGQQSLGYGRIERLFAGGRLESPAGTLDLPVFPASAAGPDLRELVLGSEGRLGVLTEATVRVTPLPEREEFHAVFFPDWERGLSAVRRIAQARLPISMLRLSNAAETETTLRLAGRAGLVHALEGYLAWRGAGAGKCLLLVGLGGRRAMVRAARREALGATPGQGGVYAGRGLGGQWQRHRFRGPYLRNGLWERGYAVDTLETAAPWSRVPALVESIESSLRAGLTDAGERVHVFTHVSHVYPDGASLYTTYLFRIGPGGEETLRRWRALKTAASRSIVSGGGTISHQHGVGTDHLPYLAAEKGELGLAALRGLAAHFDPGGLMNPGKLLG